MDVKMIEDAKPPETTYQDVGPREWFAFCEHPNVPCIRLPSQRYVEWGIGGQVTVAGISTAIRPVIKLELADTDGQTLLLRRVVP